MLLKRSIIPLMAACLALLGVVVVFADSGAPGISGVGFSGVSTSTATIEWTTATSSTSVVRYATSTADLASSTDAVMDESNLATTTNHSVQLSGLMPGTEYFFEVESSSDDVTEVDNNDESFYSFTTAEVVDDGDMATSTDDGTRKGFVGLISGFATTTVGTSTVVTGVTLVKNGTNEPIDINIGSDVQVKLPGGPNAWGSLEEAIDGGAEVVILSRQGEDGNDAIFVLVKPKRPSHAPFSGTVIGTEDGVITLALPNGKTKKVRKPEGEEDPEDGEVLTVIVENTGDGEDDGEDGDGEVAEATGLVKASQVAERIQSFLEKLAANDANLPQAAIDARQRLVANLAVVLERHSAQHVSILEKVSKAQGLGSGAAAGIQRALERAQAGQAKGNAIAADAKSKVGLGQNAGKGPKNIFGPSNSGDGSDDDDDDSGGSGKPDGAGKPADAGSQGSKGGNKGSSGD